MMSIKHVKHKNSADFDKLLIISYSILAIKMISSASALSGGYI